MLNKDYRYVGIDFETTGLDTAKDEPIQIGLVEIDVTWKIINRYKSLIKPHKKKDELKNMVWFITGLSISDLEEAPTFDEIKDEVAKFFGPNTVLIWHNISFDVAFLERYFPGVEYDCCIDTFNLAQTFVHFAPSYALEVLIEYLNDKEKLFSEILAKLDIDLNMDDTFHDALYDTQNSLALFDYCIRYIETMMDKYPILSNYLTQEDSIRAKILDIPEKKRYTPINKDDKIILQPLEKANPSNITLSAMNDSIDTSSLDNLHRYYIGNIGFKDLLAKLTPNKNIIFSFSNRQKLDIAKQHLQDLWVKNIGFAREEQVLDKDKFVKFLNKPTYDENEINFILKYVSHLYKEIGFLDFNRQSDYQIFYYLKETREPSKYPIVLCTHGGLFGMLEKENNKYKDYDIYFFDTEWWFKSYNFYLSRPCDLYFTLNLVESILYKYKVRQQTGEELQESIDGISKFYSFFETLIGVLFMETKQLFTNTDKTIIQYDPIIDNINFNQTNLLWRQLWGHLQTLSNLLDEYDLHRLVEIIDHVTHILSNMVTVNKRMYAQADFYFVYQETTTYTGRGDFAEVFTNPKTVFFSNHDRQYPKLEEGKFETNADLLPISNPDKVIDYIENRLEEIGPLEDRTYFILSTKKMQSKDLFERMYERWLHKNASLLVENITWGVGKNIFKAKTKGNKVIIGGNNFLLQMYSSKIAIDKVLVFNIKGNNEKYILDDICWYAP